MPRKSAAVRLSQSKTLYADYTSAGLDSSYQGRFISDVIRRLEAQKGLSKKQRDWIDSLIEEGVPVPQGDPAVIEKIDAALAAWTGNVDREWETNVISDFKSRLNRGYELSGKQTALMDKLLKRAEDDISGVNLLNPTEQQLADLHALVKLYGGYSPLWRGARPAVAKAVRRVCAFLCGEGTIEVYHYEKLYKAMGSKLRKFQSPRFDAGALGWIAMYNAEERVHAKYCATALTSAYIDDRGEIVNDWLCNGSVVTKSQDQVGKRR